MRVLPNTTRFFAALGSRRARAPVASGPAAFLALCVAVVMVSYLGIFVGEVQAADRWTDMPDDRWVSDYGITADQAATVADGYADETFRPYQDVTRGQFTKMAVSGLDVPASDRSEQTFTDVPPDHIFYVYVEDASAAGLIGGYADGTFGPGSTIAREQANSILGRYLSGFELETTGVITGAVRRYPSLNAWFEAEGEFYLGGFLDYGSVSPAHRAGTAYLVYREVVHGSSAELSPQSTLSRAQAVAMILRVLEAAEELSEAPPAPHDLHTLPGGPAMDPAPYVVGWALPGGEVTVYDTFEGASSTVGTTVADSGGSFSVRAGGLAEGEHSFSARVTNGSGIRSAHSDPVAYVLDQTEPEGSISMPEASGPVATSRPTFWANASDTGAGMGSVAFQYRAEGESVFRTISTDFEVPYEVSWGDVSLSQKAYELRVVLTDRAGNEGVPDSLDILVDTTDPTVAIVAPTAEGDYYTSETRPSFVANAEDPVPAGGAASGVQAVEFYYQERDQLPGEGLWEPGEFMLISRDTSAPYQAVWDEDELADGRYVLAVRSVDAAGNASDLRTQEVVVDTEAPTISLTGPEGGATYGDHCPLDLSWTAEDAEAVLVTLSYSVDDGETWVEITTSEEAAGTYPWTLPDVGSSPVTMLVRAAAEDPAANTVTDVSPSFTVAEPPDAPANPVATDPDATHAGTDGRDFRVQWDDSPCLDVVAYDVYILPEGTALDLDTQAAVGTVVAGAASERTGDASVTLDSVGDSFDPAVTYALYVVAVDSAGASTASVAALWENEDPAPPGILSATDVDTETGIDGRDVSVTWTPSESGDVVEQHVYLLPEGVAFEPSGGAQQPVGTVGSAVTSWQGTAALTVDSRGTALAAGGHNVWIVAENENGNTTASASAALTLVAP